MGADAKRKEARKRKFEAQGTGNLAITESTADNADPIAQEPPKKRNKVKGEPESMTVTNSNVPVSPMEEPGDPGVVCNATAPASDIVNQKAQRFIVFIGNLPYTATDESISKHFAKVQPKSIRHRTEKGKQKSKGFAFLEFEGYDRMKTCLKLYHGSSFDDGISPARELNVELTAGGGGRKSTDRKDKLRFKNERLNEQRARKALEKQKQNGSIDDHYSEEKKKRNSNQDKQRKDLVELAKADTPLDNSDIHPSRRGRVAAP